jgi:DNA polymerase I
LLVFDLETNGLYHNVTTIHCLSIYNTNTNTYHRFDPISRCIEEALDILEDAPEIIGHNIIGYDIPVIKKLYPSWNPKGKILDTLIWSRLIFPDIEDKDWARYNAGKLPANLIGSHSLESYGYRLGVFKGEFAKQTDWQTWTPAMSEYCEQDVVVTTKLYEKLLEKNYSEEAIKLEHEVATIISQQELNGVLFDVVKAKELYATLLKKREALRVTLQDKFKPFYKKKGVTFTPKRDNAKMGYVADCPMTKIELVDFNPGSNQHITKVLKRIYDWEPTVFTEKSGDAKIDEEILKALPYPECRLLAEYQLLEKRLGMIAEGKQAWLKAVDSKTNRIHGSVNTNGAVTGRMTHFAPNLAQTPASYSPYGNECRSLFKVPVGYKMVGCDAEGIEARALSHYLFPYDEGVYGDSVVNGNKDLGTDVHTVNMNALGINSRDMAKTWFYAFIYGAGDEKLGSILGTGKVAGKKSRMKFLTALPALKELSEAVKAKVKSQGYLIGLDGRILSIRSEHSALNALLQSAGAVLMKKALCLCADSLRKTNYDCKFILNIHDEIQMEVLEAHAQPVGEILRQSIIDAGVYFNFKCQLDAKFMIGDTWKDTH